MANIDSIAELAKSKVASYINDSMSTLPNPKINNDDETILIDDVRMAFNELPYNLTVYEEIARIENFPLDRVSLNIKGILDKSLPFYQKYLQGNTLHTILKSLTNKIIDNNFYFKIGDEIIKPDLSKYKEISRELNCYGRILINVNASESIKDFTFDVVEPYRYYQKGNTVHVITLIEDYSESGYSYPAYIVQERTIHDDGRITISVRKQYINKGQTYNFGTSITEKEVDMLHLFELTTEDGMSIVEPVRNELFMLDVTETAQAIEIKGSQFSIHAGEEYFEDCQVRIADIYRIYSSAEGLEKPLFETVQPEIRVQEYVETKNNYIKSIATDLGMNAKSLGLVQVVEMTASSEIIEETKTVESINSMRANFKQELTDILERYIPEIVVDVIQYSSQSLDAKSRVLNQIQLFTSVERKVDILYPEFTQEQKDREIALIKYEQNLPTTLKDREILKELGYQTDVEPTPVIVDNSQQRL